MVAWVTTYDLVKLAVWPWFLTLSEISNFFMVALFASNIDFLIKSWSNVTIKHISLNIGSWYLILAKKSNFALVYQMKFNRGNPNFQFILNQSFLGNLDHMNGLKRCVWVPWIMSWSIGSSSDEIVSCKPWSVKTLIWCIWWTWGLINLKWWNLAFESWWWESFDLYE